MRASQLDLKPIKEITAHFVVAAYQRGYRWREEEVEKLLVDLATNGERKYCLQPIVIKPAPDEAATFELVDGQQRLTTLYLLFDCLRQYLPTVRPAFTLSYATRFGAGAVRTQLPHPFAIDPESSIDAHFLHAAHTAIGRWFAAQPDPAGCAYALYRQLTTYVHVIWYVADAEEDATELFTRLNMGRIQLTNAELVKAKLLARPAPQGTSADRAELERKRQFEIATQWDGIEHDLQDEDFWAFLTNESAAEYPTRIELLLEWEASVASAAAGPKARSEYATFDWFAGQLDQPAGDPVRRRDAVWQSVVDRHQLLREWFHDRTLYHRIGFLVWDGVTMRTILASAADVSKSVFASRLAAQIRDRFALTPAALAELSYKEHPACRRALTLFNVESVRQSAELGVRFPFQRHKSTHGWSLEHIHARHGDDLRTEAEWRGWLQTHAPCLRRLPLVDPAERAVCARLLAEVGALLGSSHRVGELAFKELRGRMLALFGTEGEGEDPDAISNLALLEQVDNSALSNAEFDVKRREILHLEGTKYVPLCTRRAFAKFYTDAEQRRSPGDLAEDQVGSERALHHWSQRDRAAYLRAMQTTLAPYLLAEPR